MFVVNCLMIIIIPNGQAIEFFYEGSWFQYLSSLSIVFLVRPHVAIPRLPCGSPWLVHVISHWSFVSVDGTPCLTHCATNYCSNCVAYYAYHATWYPLGLLCHLTHHMYGFHVAIHHQSNSMTQPIQCDMWQDTILPHQHVDIIMMSCLHH